MEKIIEFGGFLVKITDNDATVSDLKSEQFSMRYYSGTVEHSLLFHMAQSDNDETKKALEMIVYLLANTRLILSSIEFATEFFKIVVDYVNREVSPAPEDPDETEEEILRNLKRELDNIEKIAKGE